MATAQITNAALNLFRDALIGVVTDVQIHYVAIGTGTNTPAATDTQLQTEVFRKAVTSAVTGSAIGESLTTLFLSNNDTIGTVIAEIGWFAGATATATANTGVLVARALYSPTHTHTNTEDIQLVLDSII